MATHSSVLSWRIPGMGEPGGLPSMGSHRVGHDWSDLAAVAVIHVSMWMSSRSPLGYQNAQIAYIKWHGTVSLLYAWSETSGCGEQFAYIVYVYVYMHVVSCFSHVQLFATLWAVACQAPLSMGLYRQEYWSEMPFPPPGGFSNPGIELASPMCLLPW